MSGPSSQIMAMGTQCIGRKLGAQTGKAICSRGDTNARIDVAAEEPARGRAGCWLFGTNFFGKLLWLQVELPTCPGEPDCSGKRHDVATLIPLGHQQASERPVSSLSSFLGAFSELTKSRVETQNEREKRKK